MILKKLEEEKPNKAAQKVAQWRAYLEQESSKTNEEIDEHIHRLLALFKHLKNGPVLLAYRSKRGKVILSKVSLDAYISFFKRPFEWENLSNTVPFWNMDKKCWSTFDVSNFIDWRVTYPFI